METQAILAAWATKLLHTHPNSGSGKVIRAFLANPNKDNRHSVGLNADGGASHLASETLTALTEMSEEAQAIFVGDLAALVK